MLATSDRPIVHHEEIVLANIYRREARRAVPLVFHAGMLPTRAYWYPQSGYTPPPLPKTRSAAQPLPGAGVPHHDALFLHHAHSMKSARPNLYTPSACSNQSGFDRPNQTSAGRQMTGLSNVSTATEF